MDLLQLLDLLDMLRGKFLYGEVGELGQDNVLNCVLDCFNGL